MARKYGCIGIFEIVSSETFRGVSVVTVSVLGSGPDAEAYARNRLMSDFQTRVKKELDFTA